MSLETRLRSTGQQVGGGGGSADSAGLAGNANFYLLTSGNGALANALVLTPGSSVTHHISGTGYYFNAITNGISTSGTGSFELFAQQAKLYANTSSARIDAGTPLWRLLYKNDTQQYGIWQFLTPSDYGSNPYLRIMWGVDSGMSVARSCHWLVDQWGWAPFINNSSYYIDTYGAANVVSVALSAGHSAGNLQMITVPLAVVVSFGLNVLQRIRISGSGGFVGNMELLTTHLEYTKA